METVCFCLSKEKLQKKSKRKALEQKVKELENLISTEVEERIIQEYNKCKQDREEIYNYVTEGIILRS